VFVVIAIFVPGIITRFFLMNKYQACNCRTFLPGGKIASIAAEALSAAVIFRLSDNIKKVR
jgi:hypothetical protein